MKTEIYKEGFVDALKEGMSNEILRIDMPLGILQIEDILDKLSKEYKIKNEN